MSFGCVAPPVLKKDLIPYSDALVTRKNSMAGAWLIRLAIVILNISLIILFVVADTDICGSVFETEVGK